MHIESQAGKETRVIVELHAAERDEKIEPLSPGKYSRGSTR